MRYNKILPLSYRLQRQCYSPSTFLLLLNIGIFHQPQRFLIQIWAGRQHQVYQVHSYKVKFPESSIPSHLLPRVQLHYFCQSLHLLVELLGFAPPWQLVPLQAKHHHESSSLLCASSPIVHPLPSLAPRKSWVCPTISASAPRLLFLPSTHQSSPQPSAFKHNPFYLDLTISFRSIYFSSRTFSTSSRAISWPPGNYFYRQSMKQI